MTFGKITLTLILFIHCFGLFAQTNNLPEPPRDGRCYAISQKAYKYETIEKKVKVKSAQIREEFIPPKYDTIVEKVLIKDAYTEYIPIQAEFDTTQKKMLVKDGSWIVLEKYELEQVKIVNENQVKGNWEVSETGYCTDGKEDCKTVRWAADDGTQYETQKHLKSVTTDGRLEDEYTTLDRIRLKNAARVKEVFVPAEYRDVQRRVLVAHAKKKQYEVPAEYKIVRTKKLMAESDGVEWVEILCPDMLSDIVIKQVQLALELRNYPIGTLTGAMDYTTQDALQSYQEDNGLPIGNLDRSTIEALGFNYDSFMEVLAMRQTKQP